VSLVLACEWFEQIGITFGIVLVIFVLVCIGESLNG
jgi:hypothetical protein